MNHFFWHLGVEIKKSQEPSFFTSNWGGRGDFKALKLSQPKTIMQATVCVGGLENLQTPSPSSQKKKKKSFGLRTSIETQLLLATFVGDGVGGIIKSQESSFFSSNGGLRMPEALTTGAIMQALMNIDVTIEAEVLFAFWASDTKARFVSRIWKTLLAAKTRSW